MKSINGWWFSTTERRLLNDDNRKIVIGTKHTVKGKIIPCTNGLHLSPHVLDALQYAPGPIIYRVRGSGIIVPHGDPINKYACSEREYISAGIDISDQLRSFARKSALDVIHLWHAPKIVVKYLKTGDESLRDAARDAARAAAWDAPAWAAARDAAGAAAWAARDAASAPWAAWDAAWAAASDAARAAARDAARDAASDAASDAARAAARDAARAAAWDAARAAAWAAAREKQNRRLTAMVSRAIREGEK